MIAFDEFINRCSEWLEVYCQYQPVHGRMYAARIAYRIAFKESPF